MTSQPTVSVVIPTRNRAALLKTHALPSALSQRDVDVEVVVVDDGSDVEDRRALENLTAARVRVVHHTARAGQSRARNTGIEAARGDWIAFLDDDDLWSPDKLREQLEAAAITGAEFTYTGVVMIDEARAGEVLSVLPPAPPERLLERLLRMNAIHAGASTVIARSSVVREVGGFDENLVQFTDWDLWIRLAAHGPAAVCPAVLVAYCLHDGNQMLVEPPDVSDELEYMVGKHRAAGREMNPDRAYYAHWLAAGHRRVGRERDAARIYLRSAIRHRNAGHLVRGLAMLVGEPAMRVGRRVINLVRRQPRHRPPPPAPPPWLAGLAVGGSKAPVSSADRRCDRKHEP
jgi:glycosyltransferase involved in cell wall biosynthesis